MVPGFYCSYTMLDNVPCSTNFILSRHPLVEDDQLKESLTVAKDKISHLKNGNVCIGNDFINEAALRKAD